MSRKNQPPYFKPKAQVQITRASHTQLSIGPIPSADELVKYESVKPGITDVILNTYQKQVDHRIEIENSVIKQKNQSMILGQIFSFVIVMTAIVFGFILIIKNKKVEGLTSIIVAICGLVGVFMYGRNQERKERIEKSKQIPEMK